MTGLGFGHLYIYDNNSSNSMSDWAVEREAKADTRDPGNRHDNVNRRMSKIPRRHQQSQIQVIPYKVLVFTFNNVMQKTLP